MTSPSFSGLITPHGLLACQVKTTYHCDWLTYPHKREQGQVGLEEILKLTYGKLIEMGSDNDTTHTVDVAKADWSDADRKVVDNIVAAGYFEAYMLKTVLTDLCNKDVLPAGSYAVRVSW